ncbi:MAG: flagellin, partial [Armatimonadota bacterium]
MSFQINTNVNALGALRNLNMTGSEMAKSVQRLSTGLRINSGADDPSGLIASESYRAQISGLDQAGRNVQNATNFAKTAEGGLSEVQSLLQSARTLAVANGDASLDNSAKQANQSQLDSIVASISRIANQTQFGSKNLLNGSNGASASIIQSSNITSANFQGVLGGAAVTASGNISVTMTTAATQATVSSTATYTAGTVTVGAGTFSVNGHTFTTSATSTASDVIAMVNSATGETGVTASLNSSNKLDFKSSSYGSDTAITVSDSFGLLAGSGTGASASRATGVDAVATVQIGGSGPTATFNKGKGLQLKDADGNVLNLTTTGNATTAASNMAYLSVNSSSTFQIGANSGQT